MLDQESAVPTRWPTEKPERAGTPAVATPRPFINTRTSFGVLGTRTNKVPSFGRGKSVDARAHERERNMIPKRKPLAGQPPPVVCWEEAHELAFTLPRDANPEAQARAPTP